MGWSEREREGEEREGVRRQRKSEKTEREVLQHPHPLLPSSAAQDSAKMTFWG